MALVPLVMVAASSQVAHAAPPKALINLATVLGTSSVEKAEAEAAGFEVDQVTSTQWAAMSAADFGAYQLLIIGDTGGSQSSSVAATASTWAPVVMGTAGGRTLAGNRVVIGSDPIGHIGSHPGARDLIKDGIRFAGALAGRTGLYMTTGDGVPATAVGMLNALSMGSGSWSENSSPPCGGSAALIAAHSAFADVQSSDLAGWNCSVHTSWPTFRSDWTPLAVATDTTTNVTCGTNPDTGLEACGQPYIFVAGAAVSTGPVGGPVPNEHSGSATVNSTQCDSDRPVNCFSGDFWHTFSDLVIPGRGPALDLNRTYNSDFAATDGRFGYGWNDSYGMHLVVAGDGTVTITEEGGTTLEFTPDGSGGYTALPRVLGSLSFSSVDDTYTFTRRKRARFIFDGQGLLAALSDLNGNTTTVAYDDPSNPDRQTSITDSAGRSISFTWTGARISAAEDSAGRTVTYTYDAAGDLVEVVDVGGGHWQFTYDANHRMLTMREPRFYGDTTTTPAPVTTNHYDSQGRVDWQSDPLGQTTSFDYTSIPGSTKITDPEGDVEVQRYTYGEMTARTTGYGTPQAATWTYAYDPATLGVIEKVDPNGHVTTSTYDADGNRTSITDPLGRTRRFAYDALGNMVVATDPAGVQTRWRFDAAGNLLERSSVTCPSVPCAGTNRPPVADAGANQAVAVSAAVTLSAAASTDPDGGTLSYAWTQVSGPPVTLSASTSAAPSFTPTAAGVYVFEVIVSDGTATDASEVTITAGTPRELLLVMDSSTELWGGDTKVLDQLAALGFAITAVADQSVTTAHATGKDLVWISETVSPANIGTKFRDTTAPVVVAEPRVFDDMRMTGPADGTDYGHTSTGTSLSIVDAGHPLAAGLSGTPVITTSDAELNWGVPAATAATVATLPGQGSRATIFAYDTGTAMVTGTAPARRVGLFLHADTPQKLTTAGWSLVQAAAGWAAPAAVSANRAPTADAGPNQGLLPGASATLDATGSTDPEAGTLTYTWTQVSGPAATLTGVDTANPVLTPTGAGAYRFRVAVSDGAGIDVDEVVVTVGAPRQAVLVVNKVDSRRIGDNDTTVLNVLAGLGFAVTLVDDDTVTTGHSDNKHLVWISESVLSPSTKIGAKFRDVTVPVVVGEEGVFDEMNMTGGTAADHGVTTNQTALEIVADTHPLAGGLTGSPTVISTPSSFMWGVPASGATTIASIVGQPTRAAIFGFLPGAQLTAGTAAARRVAFFPFNRVRLLNDNGLALLDAAARWATADQTTFYAHGDPGHPEDITAITDPNDHTWSFTHTATGEVASVSDPLANRTVHCYDPLGRRTMTVQPNGSGGFSCPATPPASPPAYGFLYTWDAYGAPLTMTDPLGNETVRSYDANGNLETATDPEDNTNTYTYDAANQLTTIERPDGTLVENRYFADGTLEEYEDAAGAVTSYAYDVHGRVVSGTDPIGRSTTYGYDPGGRLVSVQDPGGDCAATPKTGCTQYGYDAAGQLTTITYSDATTPDVTFGYDQTGRRTSMIDGSGTSSWSWDSLGRLVSQTDGNGETIGYAYDQASQLTTIDYPHALGTVTRTHDAAGRLTEVADWLGQTSTFDYDADSFLTTQTNPNGTQTTYTADGADRLAAISHAPTTSPTSPFASFSYERDDNDHVTSVASTGVPADDHTYSYTPLSQLAEVDSPATAYDYDPADNLILHPDATVQAFDAANQLETSSRITLVGVSTGGALASTGSFTVTLPPGIQPEDQILLSATALTGDTTAATGYTPVADASSGLGPLDARTSVFRKTATGAETTATITSLPAANVAVTVAVYRGVDPTTPVDVHADAGAPDATSLTTGSITTTDPGEQAVLFLGAGNNTSTLQWTMAGDTTMRADKTDQALRSVAVGDTLAPAADATLTGAATASTTADLTAVLLALRPATTDYDYDTRGSRTTFTPPAPGTAATLGYDQARRLTSYNAPGVTATYNYRGDGLRTDKTVAAATTSYAWSQAEPLPLLLAEATSGTTTAFIYGPGGLPIKQITATSALYLHQDQLGSTRALTNDSGTVVQTATYDAYGKATSTAGTATTPFGWAGEYQDSETGFIYLRARYYEPRTGQFLTRDPIDSITREPYVYASNDPVNGTDPTGLMSRAQCERTDGMMWDAFNGRCIEEPPPPTHGNSSYPGVQKDDRVVANGIALGDPTTSVPGSPPADGDGCSDFVGLGDAWRAAAGWLADNWDNLVQAGVGCVQTIPQGAVAGGAAGASWFGRPLEGIAIGGVAGCIIGGVNGWVGPPL